MRLPSWSTTATSCTERLDAHVLASIGMRGNDTDMQIYVFKSRRDPLALAFSNDRYGANLPADLAPWRSLWGAILPPGPKFGAFTKTRAEVEANGFCVRRTGYAA